MACPCNYSHIYHLAYQMIHKSAKPSSSLISSNLLLHLLHQARQCHHSHLLHPSIRIRITVVVFITVILQCKFIYYDLSPVLLSLALAFTVTFTPYISILSQFQHRFAGFTNRGQICHSFASLQVIVYIMSTIFERTIPIINPS